MKYLELLIIMVSLVSCGSADYSNYKDVIISRMDQMEERPKWATMDQSSFEKDRKIYFTGYSEAGAGARTSIMFKISDSNARVNISKTVNVFVSNMFQNSTEGEDGDSNFIRNYTEEETKSLLNNIKIERRYWEKVKTIDNSGDEVFRLRCYSLASIEKEKLRRLISQVSSTGISDDLLKKLDGQFDKFLDRR